MNVLRRSIFSFLLYQKMLCYVGFFLFDLVIAFPSLVWWHFVYTMMAYSPMANYACIRIYILHLSTRTHPWVCFGFC